MSEKSEKSDARRGKLILLLLLLLLPAICIIHDGTSDQRGSNLSMSGLYSSSGGGSGAPHADMDRHFVHRVLAGVSV